MTEDTAKYSTWDDWFASPAGQEDMYNAVMKVLYKIANHHDDLENSQESND